MGNVHEKLEELEGAHRMGPVTMVDAITWKVRAGNSEKIEIGQWMTLVLVYDSQYVRDQCDVHEACVIPNKRTNEQVFVSFFHFFFIS